MRITIETDEFADGGKLGKVGAMPAEVPLVDAGPALIEHIKRMTMVDGGLSASVGGGAAPVHDPGNLLAARVPTAKVPLNPLRAATVGPGAPVAQGSASIESMTVDGGRAAHLAPSDEPPAESPEPTRSRPPRGKTKVGKPRGAH